MIEDFQIFTGTPGTVAPKVQEYLNSHPKAKVISSAVTVTPKEKGSPTTTVAVCVGKVMEA